MKLESDNMKWEYLALIIIFTIFLTSLASQFVVAKSSQPHVDKEIYELLRTHEKVPVIVSLNVSSPLPSSAPEKEKEKRTQEVKAIQNDVLSNLTEAEFTLHWRYERIGGFSGLINKNGLSKLISNPHVLQVDFDKSLSYMSTENSFLKRFGTRPEILNQGGMWDRS